ncbi:MAG: peptidase S9 [Bacteroidetes bacterium HGW-Bacteroidetes-8]|jgi:dipeptidyl aminopeptidase/acylaminoacyl peptidase|nr:MAG: peptidase S9 [Bacteroidetes bacterium HGW-Bacteroidetes-8]
MIKCYLVSALLVICSILNAGAQSKTGSRKGERSKNTATEMAAKKQMTIEDVVKWSRITEREISPNGSFIAVKLEPWKGSSTVKLYNNKGVELFSADSSWSVSFDSTSQYFIYKRGSVKNSSLNIYLIEDRKERVIESVKSFATPEGWDGFVVYQKTDSTLVIESMSAGKSVLAGKASDYKVSKEGNILLFSNGSDLLLLSLGKERADTIWRGKQKVSKIALSDNGKKISFLSSGKLYVKDGDSQIMEIAGGVSDQRELFFSPDGSRLYYGVAPVTRVRDTTIAKDDFPLVHIWSWKEGKQFTQQVVDKKNESKKSDLHVFTFEKGDSFKISNDYLTETILIDKGNSSLVVGISDQRYLLEQMWNGRDRKDIYIINTFLERASLVKEGADGSVKASPGGKYIYWYSAPDSSWFTCSTSTFEVKRVTTPSTIIAYDQENDVPDWPSSYSISGWSTGDRYMLVNDRYDIWLVDPQAKEKPVNLTLDGRAKKITYRYRSSREDSDSLDLSQMLLLTGFDNLTKRDGYYSITWGENREPQLLYSGNFMLSSPVKAKMSNNYIFTKESFTEFPDIHYSDGNFKKTIRVTDANPQQKNFIWGSAELVKWTSNDGIELEGVIYKPENFDPAKKYPMIVNFYDKNSSALYSHRVPEPHRSTIDYHLYTSNGYVVFNPDIVYREGYPGESAFNAVMPGISAILNMGFVDPKRIGAQGHSWGGYQVAYLATRTTLFAAIESGAPVVNMFSAYGGIRWGTGLNRSFQYEHQQSRIGKTPWESPLRYMENSPLFTMDKVTTPILIMHNDMDGHVPWYQGIEYFTALKRLQKPVWLLNYTGEIHWPQKMSNKVDFQIRMMQFFNHYLKGEPMPKWMAPGLSAIELDYETGY